MKLRGSWKFATKNPLRSWKFGYCIQFKLEFKLELYTKYWIQNTGYCIQFHLKFN